MTEMVLRGRARESESMGGHDNGLTLQGLAKRMETLERENAQLRQEVSALRGSGTRRDEVLALRGSDEHRDGEPVSQFEGRVSRGVLLSKAGAAAVAAVAAGTLLSPRQARAHTIVNRDDVEVGNVDAHYVFAHYVQGDTEGNAGGHGVLGLAADNALSAVHGRNSGSGPGVEGIAQGSNGTGVKGTGRYGVWGESNQAGFYGVTGRNTNTDGTGVRGVANNDNGRAGVRGEGSTGVWGSSSRTGYSGVYGQHTGSSGFGIVGDGKGSGSAGILGRNNDGTAVWGQSSKTGFGVVYGQHTGTVGYGVVGDGKGANGAGILGRNSSGYGGQFEGGKAQLKLKPGGSAGKPTTGTHTKGEIYMDSAGTLFVCTANGTPGTWRKFQTAAV